MTRTLSRPVAGALFLGGLIALAALAVVGVPRVVQLLREQRPVVEVRVAIDDHAITLTNQDRRVTLYECRVHVVGATAALDASLEPGGRVSLGRQSFSPEITMAEFRDRAGRGISLTCFDEPGGRLVSIRIAAPPRP